MKHTKMTIALLAAVLTLSSSCFNSFSGSAFAASKKDSGKSTTKTEVNASSKADKGNATSSAKTDAASAEPLSVEVTNSSKSVKQGEKATVEIKTAPGANCKITVTLKSGKSSNADLAPVKADDTGKASWNWTIAKNTSPGAIEFVVNCTRKGKKASTKGTLLVEPAASADKAKK